MTNPDSPKPNASLPLFIVDDDPVVVRQMHWLFKDEFTVQSASTFQDAIDHYFRERPPVAILDLSLDNTPGSPGGIELLRLFSEADPDFHGIVLSGSIDRPAALEAVRLGAYDLIDKTTEAEELRRVVKRAMNRATLARDSREKVPVSDEDGADPLFGSAILTQCPKIKELLRTLAKVSTTDISVLITGESGTGKEVFARACHEGSRRKDGPFVAINCGAIPENLLESELFGHEKGAFTGATESRPGKFEVAHQGTLFLDEVSELPVELQVKLLRVLQDKVVERVGSRTGKKLDVRIIAATNGNLSELIASGRFREDLYYRLSVMVFHLPPLRERSGDVPLLARHFLERFKTAYQKPHLMDFSHEALALIQRYPWPGNIRELMNRIQRAVIIASGKWIRPEDLDLDSNAIHKSPSSGSHSGSLQEARGEAEKRMLTEALERSRGNISDVARNIGASRPTVHALIKKYGLVPRDFKDSARGSHS